MDRSRVDWNWDGRGMIRLGPYRTHPNSIVLKTQSPEQTSVSGTLQTARDWSTETLTVESFGLAPNPRRTLPV